MARRRRRWVVPFVLLGSSTAVLAGTAACNAIIGVEDVALRRDSGSNLPDREDGEVPDAEPGRSPIVAAGGSHTCAATPGGTVKCWGSNANGQLGNGKADDAGVTSTPTDVAGIDDAIAVAAGKSHTCIAHASGKASCWGEGSDGQLGNDDSSPSAKPVAVSGIDDAMLVTAGSSFSCALKTDGSASCWGANGAGQLGNGNATPSAKPVAVRGVTRAIAIAAGDEHACAVTGEGAVFCWGRNDFGQLGATANTTPNAPKRVSGISSAVAIGCGGLSSCAVLRDGAVKCWGSNARGQLGNDTSVETPNATPVDVSNIKDAASISLGTSHACARTREGRVWCWGNGSDGQLGDGQARDAATGQDVPSPVSGIRNATSVSAGHAHTCAPTRDGDILCWGRNAEGQLGDGKSGPPELSPVSVSGFP